MRNKILLFSLSVLVFSSCSTAYKSGQTPDDVYYSPVKYTEEKQNNDRDEVKNEPQKDYEITMRIRDHRWRDFDDSYDYRNSPYNYCSCNCKNYGYYYNPAYHPWPVYIGKYIPVNTTPRMANLNAYRGYSNIFVNDPKSGTTVNWVKPTSNYNNSNSESTRKTITPKKESSSSNNTRTYTPSTNSSSNSSPNSGSSNSGTVTRPNRGG